MISGKLENILPFLKEMINERINMIDFKRNTFDNDEMWKINYKVTNLLDLINALYQDYIIDYFNKDDVIRIDLKNYNYEKVI